MNIFILLEIPSIQRSCKRGYLHTFLPDTAFQITTEPECGIGQPGIKDRDFFHDRLHVWRHCLHEHTPIIEACKAIDFIASLLPKRLKTTCSAPRVSRYGSCRAQCSTERVDQGHLGDYVGCWVLMACFRLKYHFRTCRSVSLMSQFDQPATSDFRETQARFVFLQRLVQYV